jgi:hypothetical protein
LETLSDNIEPSSREESERLLFNKGPSTYEILTGEPDPFLSNTTRMAALPLSPKQSPNPRNRSVSPTNIGREARYKNPLQALSDPVSPLAASPHLLNPELTQSPSPPTALGKAQPEHGITIGGLAKPIFQFAREYKIVVVGAGGVDSPHF